MIGNKSLFLRGKFIKKIRITAYHINDLKKQNKRDLSSKILNFTDRRINNLL